MHFVRLLSPRFDNEDHTKDIDFSPAGIRQRWQSGYDMAMRAIENAPWNGDFRSARGRVPARAERQHAADGGGLGRGHGSADLARQRSIRNHLLAIDERFHGLHQRLPYARCPRAATRTTAFMPTANEHPIRLTPNPKRLRASMGGRVVADTDRALMLFEASYPGVRYVPLADVDRTVLRRSTHKTRCPYKGEASYYSIVSPDGVAENVIWTYESPLPAAAKIAGYLAFDTTRVDLFEGVKS